MRAKAIQDISYYYAVRLMVLWLVLSFVNALSGHGDLTKLHLAALGVVWIVASAWRYLEWQKELSAKTEGWEFDATLDETGVTTRSESEARYNWNYYIDYKEYDDCLEIRDHRGNITFVPKEPHLLEAIEFTKKHIPAR